MTGNAYDCRQAIAGATPQQITTLWWAAHGYSDQQIAEAMGLSYRTVKTRVYDLLERLDLKNRTQLALLALRAGIVRLDQIHIRAAFHVRPEDQTQCQDQ